MTSEEERSVKVEKRQESFEEFVKAYIENNNERMKQIDARLDKMDARMDKLEVEMKAMNKELGSKIDNLAKFLQSLTITAMVGMLGIAGSVIYFVYSVTTSR